MMWQLKPCMSQEFPPILQIFHCPVSLSPLHAIILCTHRWCGSDPGQSTFRGLCWKMCFAASVGASVWICCGLNLWGGFRRPRCVTVVECRRQFFSQEQQRCVRGVVHLRSVLKSMERSACQLMWVKLLTVVCVLLLLSFISLLSVSNRTTKVSSISDSEAEISTPATTWRFQQTALFIRHSQPDLWNILFLRNLNIYSLCLVDSIYGFMKWRKEISRILSVKTFDSYMSTKQLLSYRFKKQDDGAGMSTSPSVRELQMWSADPPAEVLMRVNRPRGTLKTKEKYPTMQRYRTKQQQELFRCFTVISSKALKLICLIFIFKHDI